MPKIHKFSIVYDAAEDRLAWDSEDETGAATRLWLTQRFCRELVKALVPRLPASRPGVPPEHEATVQSFEQAAAMSRFGKTPGVKVSPDSAAALAHTAHFNTTPKGMSLAFEFGQGERRNIDLDVAALRQMLAVMHGLHVSAGWPTDFWPAWIAGPGAAETTPALN